ncbi:serine protease inhibitor [Papilio machaon]|uniref:serine protease inhibitor n=1 Tax=Papilio machaon TaxID=76193 RepID=UPI001E664460|nr:serine protease inhibitor [Papilio machaon]
MTKLILLICMFVPAALARCSPRAAVQSFSKSVDEFSADLVQKLAQNTDDHFVASTLSAWTLLSYTSLGAAGTSLQELNSVLRMSSKKSCVKKFFEITKKIYSPTVGSGLEGASAIFVNKNMSVIDKFRSQVKEAGVGELVEVSADDRERVAAAINEHFKSATNGSIEKIVEADDLTDVAMIIVDVLRFKGAWTKPFPTDDTKDSPFHDEGSNEIGRVNLMTLTDFFKAWNMDDINATVVELPYDDNKFSMYVFLPYADTKLRNVIGALKTTSLRTIVERLQKVEAQEVTVSLPRFKISSNIDNLKELLTAMGLRAMFDSSAASFPRVSQWPLHVSALRQRAAVLVSERGTAASAATEAEFSFKSFSLTFTANKPFFFAIVDNETKIPVFEGAYSKPSVY